MTGSVQPSGLGFVNHLLLGPSSPANAVRSHLLGAMAASLSRGSARTRCQPSGAPGQAFRVSTSPVHSTLSCTNQFSTGVAMCGLSSVPTVTHTLSGSLSNTNVSGLPHAPQWDRTASLDER